MFFSATRGHDQTQVFLIFMGGPLFMFFGGLAVMLLGTWPMKAVVFGGERELF